MNYWLAQLILAARNRDGDGGWIQILFFIVLAVFWALGSIAKAKANKAAKGKEKTPRKPVRKPPEDFIDLKMLKQLFGLSEEAETSSQPSSQATKPESAKPQARPVSRKIVRSQPVAERKLPTEVKESFKFPTFEPQPEFKKVQGLTAEVSAPVKIPQAMYLTEIFSDYEDSEKLRRAILHYEILGKPISLRDPSEQAIRF